MPSTACARPAVSQKRRRQNRIGPFPRALVEPLFARPPARHALWSTPPHVASKRPHNNDHTCSDEQQPAGDCAHSPGGCRRVYAVPEEGREGAFESHLQGRCRDQGDGGPREAGCRQHQGRGDRSSEATAAVKSERRDDRTASRPETCSCVRSMVSNRLSALCSTRRRPLLRLLDALRLLTWPLRYCTRIACPQPRARPDGRAACMRRNVSLRGPSSVVQAGGDPSWQQLCLLRANANATCGSAWTPVDAAVFWPVHGATFAVSAVPHVTAQCTRNTVHTNPLHWARTHEPPSCSWSALVDVRKGSAQLSAHGIGDGSLAEAGAQVQVTLPRRLGVCQVVAGDATPWGAPDLELSWSPPAGAALPADQHSWRVCKPGDGPVAVELQCAGTAVRLDERAQVHVQHVLRPGWCTCRVKAILLQGVQVKLQTVGATTLGVSIDTQQAQAEATLKVKMRTGPSVTTSVVHRKGGGPPKLLVSLSSSGRSHHDVCLDTRDGSTLESDVRGRDTRVQVALIMQGRACAAISTGSLACLD